MAEIMTLKDLAEYLRMNERTIAKLAQDGKIPGLKVASQWRFSKESIDNWFAREMHSASTSGTFDEKRARIADLLAPESITMELKNHTKDGILSEMTDMLVHAGRVASGPTLLTALRDREKLCSTGIGRGISFLHPRHVITDIAKEPVLAFGRSAKGVDFDAVDGEKVHFFFLDCAPSERMHLAMLARLARLLADDNLLEKLRAAATPEDAIRVIRQAENALAPGESVN